MRTPIWVLFFAGLVVVPFFSSFGYCYDEAPWPPVVYDYYHIDLSELGGHHGIPVSNPQEGQGSFGAKIPVPKDAIVDVINDLGIKMLAIHNEHNENNIAISPYGAFSVLAALGEGLQGDSAHEIIHAAHIPKDKHVTRVGLRDIHRHLKSYFIPEEGFLAGLTLNLNNVTLRSEYQDVLRFYGFDYGSFNNALYPEPLTTRKPAEGTTLETGIGISEETTTMPPTRKEETTTNEATSTIESSTPPGTTVTQLLSTTILSTIEGKEEMTMEPTTIMPTTILINDRSKEITTTEQVTTTKTTTSKELILEASGTTENKIEGTTEKVITTTLTPTTTSLPLTTTTLKPRDSTTITLQTSIKVPPDAITSTTTTMTESTTETTTVAPATTTLPTTSNTIRTTREIATTANKPDETPLTTKAATTIITTANVTDEVSTTEPTGSSTMTALEDTTTVPFVIVPMTTEFAADQTPLVDIETTTPFFFGTTPEFQDMTNAPANFDFNNYNYDANNVPPVYDETMPNVPAPAGAALNDNFKRNVRSVVDYVIARFYDDRNPYLGFPQRRQYLAQDPLTFAVYGKFRESGINFMKYDTVLPYFYVQNLNAVALSFPLDSTKYYLLLLLPLRDDGVDQLVCDLRLHGNLRYIIDNLRLTHVVATIPSFMLKGYVTLTPTLQRLGIRRIFEPRQADFTPMTNVTDIYVTNIEQAVTVTIRNYLDPSAQHYKNFRQYPPVQFNADHPFLYFVVDSELHVALMVGKVVNPLNSRIS